MYGSRDMSSMDNPWNTNNNLSSMETAEEVDMTLNIIGMGEKKQYKHVLVYNYNHKRAKMIFACVSEDIYCNRL